MGLNICVVKPLGRVSFGLFQHLPSGILSCFMDDRFL